MAAKGGGSQPASGPVYTNDQWSINQANQLRNQQFQQAQLEANRARAMNQGRQWGQEMFGHGTMPRLREGRTQEQSDMLAQRRGTTQAAGQRSGATQDILNRYQNQLGGYTAPENAAMRQRAYESFQNQSQTDQRNLQRSQANNFVSGPAAAAQIARLGAANSASAANAERDMMLNDITNRQNMLDKYAQANAGAEGTEWQRYTDALGNEENTGNRIQDLERSAQEYNNQQYNRETAGQVQAMLGQMGLSSGDWASAAQSAIANQQMQSAMNTGSSGKK